jgi:hypothetical protein
MFDLDSWLHCSTTGAVDLLAEARSVLWETIGNTRGVPLVEQPERMLFIPTSIKNPIRKSFRSVGTKNPLPDHLPPLSPETEKRLLFALMDDLNKNFGVGIDPYPSLERGAVTQAIDSKQGRLVLVGASHMTRLATVMGPRAVSLAYLGFRPREPMLSELIEQLKSLNLGKLDTGCLGSVI